jgi:hypothetical protein
MQQTVWKAWKHLGADKRASNAISADLGLGLEKPLLFFSQLYFSRGMHFGIEFDKGLNLTANGNVNWVTLKGWANVDGGLFAKDNIKENGKLSHVRPPHVALVHGDIHPQTGLHRYAAWCND